MTSRTNFFFFLSFAVFAISADGLCASDKAEFTYKNRVYKRDAQGRLLRKRRWLWSFRVVEGSKLSDLIAQVVTDDGSQESDSDGVSRIRNALGLSQKSDAAAPVRQKEPEAGLASIDLSSTTDPEVASVLDPDNPSGPTLIVRTDDAQSTTEPDVDSANDLVAALVSPKKASLARAPQTPARPENDSQDKSPQASVVKPSVVEGAGDTALDTSTPDTPVVTVPVEPPLVITEKAPEVLIESPIAPVIATPVSGGSSPDAPAVATTPDKTVDAPASSPVLPSGTTDRRKLIVTSVVAALGVTGLGYLVYKLRTDLSWQVRAKALYKKTADFFTDCSFFTSKAERGEHGV